jgi:hypothetical protein
MPTSVSCSYLDAVKTRIGELPLSATVSCRLNLLPNHHHSGMYDKWVEFYREARVVLAEIAEEEERSGGTLADGNIVHKVCDRCGKTGEMTTCKTCKSVGYCSKEW